MGDSRAAITGPRHEKMLANIKRRRSWRVMLPTGVFPLTAGSRRISLDSIFCRTCSRESSPVTVTTWRHDLSDGHLSGRLVEILNALLRPPLSKKLCKTI